MLEKTIVIASKTGIHARPAGLIVREAQKYQSETVLIKNGNEYSCKSIISIMSMAAKQGEEILLRVTGSDEEEAFNGLVNLLEKDLDE